MNWSFRDFLSNKNHIVVFDGAMGTYLYQKGIYINVCYEHLNLSSPDLIKSIHQEYIHSGVEVIKTNTFGANRFKLSNAGIDHQLEDIIKNGVFIAKNAGEKSGIFVAGDIGPLGKLLYPLGPIAQKDAYYYFKEIIELFVNNGVDLILFETFSDIAELELAVSIVKEVSDIPVIAQISITEDGSTLLGATPEQLAELSYKYEIDVIGFNCSVGPHHMLEAVQRLRKYSGLTVSVQPNAGMPRVIDNRTIYLTTPEYFASYARRYILNNVRVIGGCCGIHPQHIKELKNSVKAVAYGVAEDTVSPPVTIHVEEKVIHTPVRTEEKSHFATRLCAGAFVSSIEITAPKGSDPQKVIESAAYLKENGIDAVNIPDGPRASARMSPQMLAVILQYKVGMETIMHYCCRDRNVIGMQSDLLGASAAGLNNILAITGDPPKLGNYPDATAVFDVDSIGLVKIIRGLNQGMDLAGNDIINPTKFLIGVGINPAAVNYNLEIERLHKKFEAGAEFAITQPVFDPEKLIKFLDDIIKIPIPIIVGIWPLASYRNAEFLNSEIPEVTIPDYIMERMRKVADNKESSLMEGVEIARETLQQVKQRVNGVQVSAPFGKVDIALKVVDGFITPDPYYQKLTHNIGQ